VLRSLKNALIALGRKLPSGARSRLFHFAYNCAPEEFERFSYLYHPGSREHLRCIAARGFSPKLAIDVGAYEGEWSKTIASIWPGCRIVMVEPNRDKTAVINQVAKTLQATLVTELLGAEDGKVVEFHLMETGSSVFPERSGAPKKMETRTLRSLDSILSTHPPPDLLKIDAQGYELEILAGAHRTLQHASAVILEASLIEVNMGCPLLDEVIAFMAKEGFVAYDILEMHRRPLDKALFQIDVFFCRSDAILRADKRFA
jgi:FkbM family methyltransferase